MKTKTFGELNALSPVDETYECVMERPKRIVLKSHRFQVIQEAHKVQGFTRGKDGVNRPNGLEITVLGKVVGYKDLGLA